MWRWNGRTAVCLWWFWIAIHDSKWLYFCYCRLVTRKVLCGFGVMFAVNSHIFAWYVNKQGAACAGLVSYAYGGGWLIGGERSWWVDLRHTYLRGNSKHGSWNFHLTYSVNYRHGMHCFSFGIRSLENEFLNTSEEDFWTKYWVPRYSCSAQAISHTCAHSEGF